MTIFRKTNKIGEKLYFNVFANVLCSPDKLKLYYQWFEYNISTYLIVFYFHHHHMCFILHVFLFLHVKKKKFIQEM